MKKVLITTAVATLVLISLFVLISGKEEVVNLEEDKDVKEVEENLLAYEELVESFGNMYDLDSLIFGGSLYIEGDFYLERIEGVVDLEWETILDVENKNNESLFDANIYLENLEVEEAIELLSSGTAIYFDGALFGKLNQLTLSTNTEDPAMLEFDDMVEDLTKEIKGDYFLLSENLTEDINEEMHGCDYSSGTCTYYNFPDYYYYYYYYLESDKEEKKQFLMDLFKDNVLEVTKTERDYVDGKANNKYTIVFNGEMAKEHSDGEVDTEDVDVSLQVWADGDYITKTELSFSGETSEGWISLSLNLYFSDFNEDLDIIAPRSYINLHDLDVFENIKQHYNYYGAYDIVTDADKKAMISQARSVSQLYYADNNWSYSGVEEELKEVAGTFEDETEYNTTNDGYCIEVELSSGSYYCTDNNLDLVENTTRKCTPSSVSCY